MAIPSKDVVMEKFISWIKGWFWNGCQSGNIGRIGLSVKIFPIFLQNRVVTENPIPIWFENLESICKKNEFGWKQLYPIDTN